MIDVDYREEQRKLVGAELVVLQYRTVLNTHPAALKAWLEAVLTQNDGQRVDRVALKVWPE